MVNHAHEVPALPQFPVDAVIIAGDMNQDQYGDADDGGERRAPDLRAASAFQPFFSNGFEVVDDLSPTEMKRADPQDFNSPVVEGDEKRRIDHVVAKVNGLGVVLKLKAHELHRFDVNGSDHKMVAMRIRLKPAPESLPFFRNHFVKIEAGGGLDAHVAQPRRMP